MKTRTGRRLFEGPVLIGAATLRYKQFSDVVTLGDRWGLVAIQAGPKATASRGLSVHGPCGSGRRQRRFPVGDSAYGMRLNTDINGENDEVDPRRVPRPGTSTNTAATCNSRRLTTSKASLISFWFRLGVCSGNLPVRNTDGRRDRVPQSDSGLSASSQNSILVSC